VWERDEYIKTFLFHFSFTVSLEINTLFFVLYFFFFPSGESKSVWRAGGAGDSHTIFKWFDTLTAKNRANRGLIPYSIRSS